MPATQAEVGSVYDLLLQTRDGSTLPCRNKDGKLVNVSQVAYCTSIDRNAQGQHEETELQHKDQLIQLGSSNLIDREFDQWPQVSQGDWSGGALQHVLTGATPLTSFGPQSDPTKYWDGLGLLWPVTDYLPQQSVLPSPDQAESGSVMKFAGNGSVAGHVASVTGSNMVLAYAYMQNAAPQHNILCLQLANGVLRKLNPMPGSTNGTPFVSCDYTIAQGVLFYAYDSGGNVIQVATISSDSPPVTTNAFTIANAVLNASGNQFGRIAAGTVAGRTYVAVAYTQTTGSQEQVMEVFDVTPGLNGSSVSAPIILSPTGLRGSVQQIEFSGDNIVVGVSSGFANGGDGSWVGGTECAIFQWAISSQTLSTLANFQGYNNVWFCPIAGSLFVLATLDAAGFGFPNSVNMYLLQGSNLQDIGSVRVQATNQAQSNTITGVCEPRPLGSYAVFPVYYFSGTNTRISIFAYDVLRGRLFKLNDIGSFDQFLGNLHGRRFGIYSAMTRSFGSGSLAVQHGVSVPTLSSSGSAQDVSNVQELLIGVSNGSFNPYLQQGVQITSSLIDFTSAQPKLFRQAVMTWLNPGLPSDSAVMVQLDVWLDQDPTSLNAVPDFTTGAVATGVNGGVLGQTTLKLLINKIAKKLVYRVTTTGPSTTLTPAVKLVSVVIQAASGWVQTLKLDLAPNVQTNSKNGNVWDKQSTPGTPATDHVVAYNFLRQLWRLKGGEVTATFPNGDSGDWLLQDLHFDSPKPMASSFRADQQTTYQTICTAKFREDL